LGEISNFYQEIVDYHKSTFDPNNIRDVIDSYILEIQNAKEEGRQERLFDGKDGGQIPPFSFVILIASAKPIISQCDNR
jgi:hypothetical protein